MAVLLPHSSHTESSRAGSARTSQLLHDARRLNWGVWVEEPELLDSVLELQHAQDGAPLLDLQQEVQKRVQAFAALHASWQLARPAPVPVPAQPTAVPVLVDWEASKKPPRTPSPPRRRRLADVSNAQGLLQPAAAGATTAAAAVSRKRQLPLLVDEEVTEARVQGKRRCL